MNKENVKINITCASGRVEEIQSDAVYGCALTENEEGGVSCRSFFTGRYNPVKIGVPIGVPMATSVALVAKEMCDGNPELEYIILDQVINVLAAKLEELAEGNSHGWN